MFKTVKKINILTLVLFEKKFLNETKNHNPPFKLNGRSLNKHQRIPKGQSKIDNPEKLATLGIRIFF